MDQNGAEKKYFHSSLFYSQFNHKEFLAFWTEILYMAETGIKLWFL